MKLTHKQLEVAAKKVGVSERAIERLLGTTTLEIVKPIDLEQADLHHIADSAKERFQVGIRLSGETQLAWTNAIETEVVKRLLEYRTLCPQVFSWICAGNFDPKKLPESLDRGKVFHASRTASRLRASILREIQRQLRI